ncbi:hypothetical protein AVEN_150484-1 [Araneus ventricosus]|uniref:Uncharacterized protein n=1 Tax=Araneus ventricosus TaxID=182803 RepID=A0A4Y2H8N1_ARAVE|nr:hypothetical protein AVEN_150484-1 [Araneus ventricosus]
MLRDHCISKACHDQLPMNNRSKKHPPQPSCSFPPGIEECLDIPSRTEPMDSGSSNSLFKEGLARSVTTSCGFDNQWRYSPVTVCR